MPFTVKNVGYSPENNIKTKSVRLGNGNILLHYFRIVYRNRYIVWFAFTQRIVYNSVETEGKKKHLNFLDFITRRGRNRATLEFTFETINRRHYSKTISV